MNLLNAKISKCALKGLDFYVHTHKKKVFMGAELRIPSVTCNNSGHNSEPPT